MKRKVPSCQLTDGDNIEIIDFQAHNSETEETRNITSRKFITENLFLFLLARDPRWR